MRAIAFLFFVLHGALLAAPPEPLALSPTGVSGELALNWAAVITPTAATSYQIYRATYVDLTAVAPYSVTTLSDVSTGLTDGTRYWMAVAPVGGTQSLTSSAVPWAPIDAPSLVTTALPFGAGINAQWASPATHGYAVGAYRIEQGTSIIRTVAATVSQTTLSFACATGVTLQVRAVDVLGHTGTASAPSSASFACAPLATPLSLSSGALSLSWLGTPGTLSPSAQYQVRYATFAGASYAQTTLDFATPLILTVTAQAPQNVSRWYQVFDQDTGGLLSAGSNELAILAPPSGLSASGRQGRVLLDWSRPSAALGSGVTSYQVYYATYSLPLSNTAGTTELIVPDPGTGSFVHATISSLADGVPVYFRVAAEGGTVSAQVGTLGSAVSATPYLPAPLISAFNQLQGSLITLAWTAPDISPNTFAAYKVYAATDSFLTTKSLLATVTGTGTVATLTPTGAPDNYWFVQVSDTAGDSSSFTPTSGVLFAPPLLTPVVSVSLTSNARVFLSWTADLNATEYQIYRATQGVTGTAAAFITQGIWVTQTNSFIDTKPINGQANLYRVLARRKLNLGQASLAESPLSLSVSAMPSVAPGIPGVFKVGTGFGAYLTATVRANTGLVDLRWAPSAAGSRLISRYRVYQGRSVSSLSFLDTVYNGLTTYAHVSQDPSSQAYGVEAVDVSGTVSLRLTGTASAFVPWPAPQNPTAWVLSSGVRLAWSAPASKGSNPLSAYTVYRRDQFASADVFVTSVAGTSFTDATLPSASQGPQLSYFIGATDDRGVLGSLTGVAAAFGPVAFTGAVPSSPTTVVARTLTGTSIPVLLQWQPNPEAEGVTSTGYALYRDGVFFASTTASSAIDSGTTVGGSHSYGVQAVNVIGPGLTSTAAPSPLGIRPPAPAFVSVSYTVDPAGSPTLAYRLNWEDLGVPAGVDSYDVFRNGALLANVGVPNYVDSAIGGFAGTYVTYTVASKVGAFNSISPAALALSVTAVVAPTGFTASAKNGTVRLDWAPQGQARQFWLYRDTAVLGANPVVAHFASVTAVSFTDTGVNANNTWHYGVAALNELGRSPVVEGAIEPQPGLATSVSLTAGYGTAPQVSLDWTAPASPLDATAYEIWRGTSADTLAKIFAATGTNAVDASLTANTAYFYQVRSYNRDFSQGAPTKGPIKAFGPPAMPTGLRADGGPNRLDVAWDPPAVAQSVTGYALSVAAWDGSNTFSLNLPARPNAVALSGLASATSFSVSLTAMGSGGASALTATAGQTNAAGPAAVPVSLTARVGFYDFVKVNLTWSPVGSGKNALLYRHTAPIPLSLSAGGPASPLYLTGLAGTLGQLTDLSVTAGQDYYYALTALGPDGLPGGESLPIHTGPVAPFLYPSAVHLTVTAGLGRVDLQWSPPSFSGTAGLGLSPEYRIYRYQSALTYTAVGLVALDSGFPVRTTATVYTDTQVANNLPYQYFVTVVDQAGREQDAGEGRLSIVPRGLPATPDGPLAVAGDASVALRWLAQKSDTQQGLKFNVYRRKPLTDEDYGPPVANLFQAGPSAVTEFQGTVQMLVMTLRDDGSPGSLSNTTRYCYALSQVNETGEGGKSQEVCVTPFRPIRPVNLNLSNVVVGKKDVSLAWDGSMAVAPSVNAGSYPLQAFRVYRSVDGGTTYALLAQVTSTAYVDSSTSFGASYVYRVAPLDSQGNEGYNYNLINIVIPAAQNSLLIFRNSFNPALNETVPIQYSLVQPGHAWVRIYTLQGEFVAGLFEEDVVQASADNPYLSQKKDWDGKNASGQTVASGVYMVHLEAPGYRSNARVAVIK